MVILDILILEDDINRTFQFFKMFKGNNTQIVVSPDECIQKLKDFKWDVLFLDHDLGGEIYCPSDDKSGYKVAKWLEESPEYKPTKIYLHSMNSVGRQNMKNAIPEAIELPFAFLINKIINKE